MSNFPNHNTNYLTNRGLYRKNTIMEMQETLKVYNLTSDEERLTQMMKALGNPARMQIVRYLSENPGCITGNIVDALPLAQATVSQHLKVLREAGWTVVSVPRGAALEELWRQADRERNGVVAASGGEVPA